MQAKKVLIYVLVSYSKKFMKSVLKQSFLCCLAIPKNISVTQEQLEQFSMLTWQWSIKNRCLILSTSFFYLGMR